jgi:hypothetical protein
VARTVAAPAVDSPEQRRARWCEQGKVAKGAREGSKMATRLPSTGLKMAKMANHMEMGDTCDTLDRIDDLASDAGRRGG